MAGEGRWGKCGLDWLKLHRAVLQNKRMGGFILSVASIYTHARHSPRRRASIHVLQVSGATFEFMSGGQITR